MRLHAFAIVSEYVNAATSFRGVGTRGRSSLCRAEQLVLSEARLSCTETFTDRSVWFQGWIGVVPDVRLSVRPE